MKRLVIYELRKLLIRRVWISIAVCLAVTLFYFLNTYPSGMNDISAVNKEKPELIAALKGPIKSDLAKKYAPSLEMERAEDRIGTNEEKIEWIVQQKYASAAYRADRFKETLNDMRLKKAQLESQGKQDSYLYKDANKKLVMMEQLDPPGFQVTRSWENLFLFISGLPSAGTLFMSMILVLALAPLFAGEANYRMDPLILSSKYGRQSIITAKLIAGFLFTFGWVTAFYGVCVIVSGMLFGFIGWDAPLNSFYLFDNSPYAWTQLQGLWAQYLIALLGACGLLLLIALISAVFRSSLSSLGLATALIFLPFITFPGFLGKIIVLLPPSIMGSRALIESYKSYQIFNTPVMYLTLSIVVTFMIGILAAALIPKAFKRRLKF